MALILTTKRFGEVNFGSVFSAPGARGFCGEGYPIHDYLKYFGLTWEGTTFVAKTVTLEPNIGNMSLKENGMTPRDLMPSCIIAKPLSGHFLNAVKLSNKGFEFYRDLGLWQKISRPFCLSWMPISENKGERLQEARDFVKVSKRFFQNLNTPVALQLNRACPSIKSFREDPQTEIDETTELLEILAELEVPIILNFNPLVPIKLLVGVSNHPTCSALWIANTIPWGSTGIDWKGIFGTEVSPLITRGFKQAGGLSGPACRPIAVKKILLARNYGIRIPIVGGNGIKCGKHVLDFQGRADAIAFACAALDRTTFVKGIIRTGNLCFAANQNQPQQESLQ
ncbi:MAG: hypothetical protein PHT88_05500 [Candidatus Moranbacteria bacterium]|nr:hypothetical protein [Candidatus Moranbacteria bacterium]